MNFFLLLYIEYKNIPSLGSSVLRKKELNIGFHKKIDVNFTIISIRPMVIEHSNKLIVHAGIIQYKTTIIQHQILFQYFSSISG